MYTRMDVWMYVCMHGKIPSKEEKLSRRRVVCDKDMKRRSEGEGIHYRSDDI